MPETANAGLIARQEGRDDAATLAAVPLDDPFEASPPGPRPRRRYRGWYRLISPVAVVLLWQLLSSAGLIPADKLPPPTTIWHTAVTLVTTNSPAYGTLQGAMLVSLERMAVGFAVGGTIAVLLALVAGLSRLGENAVDPLLQILRMLPLFGLIPVFIVWFGIGELPKIILIALGAAIPLYLNTFAGIRSVDANAGLGFMISQATQFLRNDVILVALAVYAVLGLITDGLVRLLERRALTWRRGLLE